MEDRSNKARGHVFIAMCIAAIASAFKSDEGKTALSAISLGAENTGKLLGMMAKEASLDKRNVSYSGIAFLDSLKIEDVNEIGSTLAAMQLGIAEVQHSVADYLAETRSDEQFAFMRQERAARREKQKETSDKLAEKIDSLIEEIAEVCGLKL